MYQSAWSGDVFQYLPNGNYSILFNTYWSNPEHRWPDAEFATNRVNITNNLILNTDRAGNPIRSEEHTSELQSLMRISYAVFCLKKKTHYRIQNKNDTKT